MNLIEIFHEWLDSLYYEGYSQQIAVEYPELYEWEYLLFMEIYVY